MDLRSVAYELADAEIRFEQSAEEIGAKRSGFVYLITNPAWPGLVKIGKAANPRARLAALNTADPYRRFRVVYQQFFDQALQVESELHSRLADRRVDGEWFRMTVKGAKAALYSVWEAA